MLMYVIQHRHSKLYWSGPMCSWIEDMTLATHTTYKPELNGIESLFWRVVPVYEEPLIVMPVLG